MASLSKAQYIEMTHFKTAFPIIIPHLYRTQPFNKMNQNFRFPNKIQIGQSETSNKLKPYLKARANLNPIR